MTKEESEKDSAQPVDANHSAPTDLAETVKEEVDYKDKWQRALADLENLRKRSEQERGNLLKYGLSGFLEELLPVVDNFYRATEHVPADQKDSPWVTGIQYIQKNLLDVLERQGVKEISVKPGDPFDPTRHESVGAQISDLPEDSVVAVQNRGYLLGDRVLRPAQVIISKPEESK